MPNNPERFEIFLVCPPGLEEWLAGEAVANRFSAPKAVPGGVVFQGRLQDAWRANLCLRGATRVLLRIAGFRAVHLAKLAKRLQQIDWRRHFVPGSVIRVDASAQQSRIYHTGAARERLAKALEAAGFTVRDEAPFSVRLRLVDDFCTVSLDTSGTPLFKRGYKEGVAKAPLRENLAALFLRACGFSADEPVLDPMCGSGTFVIEAATMAAGLMPGRSRHFAFEEFASFDAELWQAIQDKSGTGRAVEPVFFGFDRDAGAIGLAKANAERAGCGGFAAFTEQAVSAFAPPVPGPGLIMVNPPYGERVGDPAQLTNLYRALGHVLKERFTGWRLGLVTNDGKLANAVGLGLKATTGPVDHGGQKIRLYRANL